MRSILWTALVLVPAAATAGPSCAVPPAETPPAIPATAAQQAPPTAASPTALGKDAIARSPALERIASQGAELSDLGEAHGLRTIFARKGTAFQVFYLTGDSEAVVGGVMWDAAGQDITRQQVSSIPGAVPTVSIGTPSPAPAQAASDALSGPKLLQMMATMRYGTEGDPKAPRLWMFIDPYSPSRQGASSSFGPMSSRADCNSPSFPSPCLTMRIKAGARRPRRSWLPCRPTTWSRPGRGEAGRSAAGRRRRQAAAQRCGQGCDRAERNADLPLAAGGRHGRACGRDTGGPRRHDCVDRALSHGTSAWQRRYFATPALPVQSRLEAGLRRTHRSAADRPYRRSRRRDRPSRPADQHRPRF